MPPPSDDASPAAPAPGGPPGDRAGYDEHFLGPPVPLPLPADQSITTVVLPYTHFSVAFRPDRWLAASTAVMIDGRQLTDAPREDDWRLDPRLPGDQQAGNPVYEHNAFDKGHLVRRMDPVWGTAEEARRANRDTFHYTNAAPQLNTFNQGKQLWQGLENYLLEHAAAFDRKLTVLTGPVLHDTDPPYRGVKIPLRFWKIAAFLHNDALACTAYVLDQSPDLPCQAAAHPPPAAAPAPAPPPLGAFRTFQVPVADIAHLTGLDLGPLPAADRFPPALHTAQRWRRLTALEEITV